MPEAGQPLMVLEPPKAVMPVAPEVTSSMVKLEPEYLTELDRKVDEFVNAVVALDGHSEEFRGKVHAIHSLANKEIKQAASVSNRLLERSSRAMDEGLFGDKTSVSQSLVELRRTVEDLDPSRQGDLLSPRRILGVFPFGNRLRDYFAKYRSSQSQINAIIEALYHGQDELRRDNAAIEQEKANMWGLMGRLEQYAYWGRRIDSALESRIAEIESRDPEKARVVREEMLFYVRQKVQDLLTQQAVNVQGYLALDMVRKNNLELIKGVDRAATTTVSALRTAVIVAQALTNQKLVLDQIGALNTTTGNLIESTSALLRGQSAEIQRQAATSTIEIDKLRTAFNNIYETMDMLADYKSKALGVMRESVDALSTEVAKAQSYVDRVRDQEAREATAGPPAQEVVEL